MNILIVGCGKTGSRLANILSHQGHAVSVLDRRASSFNKLDDNFNGFTIAGVPMDLDVLRQAGIESCDVVATVTDDDNVNIMVAQIAKEFFNVNRVVTRILDPSREDVFHQFGLETICPTRLTASAMVEVLVDGHQDKLVHFGLSAVVFSLRSIERAWVGRRLADVPVKHEEVIFAVISGGHMQLASDGNYLLQDDDELVISKIAH